MTGPLHLQCLLCHPRVVTLPPSKSSQGIRLACDGCCYLHSRRRCQTTELGVTLVSTERPLWLGCHGGLSRQSLCSYSTVHHNPRQTIAVDIIMPIAILCALEYDSWMES